MMSAGLMLPIIGMDLIVRSKRRRLHETDGILGLVVDLPTQCSGPEARETERIVRIEAEGDEPR